jgi:hypothetical protein
VPDAQQKLAIRTLYDREVQFTDHVLGLFFAELERLQLFDRSLVVVLSDHGEEFFEHGGFEHGHSVMPEVAGIPWLIRWPGGRDAGTVIDAAVCQLDVLPTAKRRRRHGRWIATALRRELALWAAARRLAGLAVLSGARRGRRGRGVVRFVHRPRGAVPPGGGAA